jgi:glycosyltransferase involved in cell wall biosynthesis
MRIMYPIVSVVIATRNRAQHLRACLESLRLSVLPAGWMAEAIVVDNGSTDNTAAVVTALVGDGDAVAVRYLVEQCRGKAFAVNTGTTAARGAIVAFLDDDVTVDRRWLAEVVAHFDREPDLGLLAGRVVEAEPGGGVAITRASEATALNPSGPLEGFVLGCNLAVRPHVIAAVQGRDTRLGPGRGLAYEDIDFAYRILRAGFRGHFSPLPVVFHRPGVRNRRVEYLRGRGAYYVKFILRGDRTIARRAWWEVSGLWRALWESGPRRSGSPLAAGWHLAVGAALMAGRMLVSSIRVPGSRARCSPRHQGRTS